MPVDQLLRDAQRARGSAAREGEPLDEVGRDGGVPASHLAPGQRPVAIAVEADRELEVAQGDVDRARDRVRLDREAEIGVRSLVRGGRAGRQAQQQGEQAGFHEAPPRRLARAASATSSILVCAIHSSAGRAASGSPAAERRLEQDARIPWLALHGPIRLGERQRRLGLVREVQEETGLLTLMQAIAALPTRRKARPQFFDVRVPPRGADLTLGQGQAQEQTIDPRLFAQECHHLSRAPLVEEEIRVRPEEIGIVGAEPPRLLEMDLGALPIAHPFRGLAEQRLQAHLLGRRGPM